MSEHQAKKLFDSMSNLSDELVEEACPVKSTRQKKPWLKWCAAAACLCLVVGGIFAAIRSTGSVPENRQITQLPSGKYTLQPSV